jgi:hypothetical protein
MTKMAAQQDKKYKKNYKPKESHRRTGSCKK